MTDEQLNRIEDKCDYIIKVLRLMNGLPAEQKENKDD